MVETWMSLKMAVQLAGSFDDEGNECDNKICELLSLILAVGDGTGLQISGRSFKSHNT